MDQPEYRVLLEGRLVGPYDRKTILGMRIKQMLSSDDILVRGDGSKLTVREMARHDQPGRAQSKVRATDPAAAEPLESPVAATPMPRARANASPASSAQVLAVAMAGIAVVVAVVLLVLLLRRVY